jgi:hypothetical protein
MQIITVINNIFWSYWHTFVMLSRCINPKKTNLSCYKDEFTSRNFFERENE